jgi:hypothetical protein
MGRRCGLVAAAITAAAALSKKVGLRAGWGPAKSELALPPGVDAETLSLPRGEDGRILPHLVVGLEACLGIPRHLLQVCGVNMFGHVIAATPLPIFAILRRPKIFWW